MYLMQCVMYSQQFLCITSFSSLYTADIHPHQQHRAHHCSCSSLFSSKQQLPISQAIIIKQALAIPQATPAIFFSSCQLKQPIHCILGNIRRKSWFSFHYCCDCYNPINCHQGDGKIQATHSVLPNAMIPGETNMQFTNIKSLCKLPVIYLIRNRFFNSSIYQCRKIVCTFYKATNNKSLSNSNSIEAPPSGSSDPSSE